MAQLDRITIDPEICLGQPTIRGMRITVSLILKLVANRMGTKEIIKAYPELEEEDIIQLTSTIYRKKKGGEIYGCNSQKT